jgi:hypothetical protein
MASLLLIPAIVQYLPHSLDLPRARNPGVAGNSDQGCRAHNDAPTR